jgi:phosphatidylethanolamine/phosphatidyl-N-methylethanolamine N-methyltransferase
MMVGSGLRQIAGKFDDELRFFKGWLDKPKAVGAIMPTSSVTARRMASVIDTASGLPVLELGPGTGVITRAILKRGVDPQDLYTVEYSEDFAGFLRREFPDVHVIQGDAFNLDEALGEDRHLKFDAVISAVPLLSFPVASRIAYVEDLLDRMPEAAPWCS